MWRTIKKVLDKDSALSSIPIGNFQDRVFDRPNEIAKAFNKHFVSAGPKLASSIDQKPDDEPLRYLKGTDENSPKLLSRQVDTSYIKKGVMALKVSKSPRLDKFPTKLLRDAIKAICQPLVIVFNAPLEIGTFPDTWKLARVTPTYTSGQKSNLSNYSWILVLAVFSRLLEKLAHDQLYDFF